MKTNYQGENLIFLISQPRAGSTLLQRILGNHPEIHTQSEPWILLHPLHALKPESNHAVFESDYYAKALVNLIDKLPGGLVRYREIISEAYQKVYNEILVTHHKRYFLDKTPRYYYIIEEINEYYPKAKFIFLLRNPIAVLVSMINSWAKGRLHYLANHRNDLLLAPKMIINGAQKVLNNSISIKYEELLSEPELKIKQICSFLKIKPVEGLSNYGKADAAQWSFGDQKNVYNKSKPDDAHIQLWQDSLCDPQVWRLAHEYLNILGQETFKHLGYSYQENIEIINRNKPALNIEKQSLPLLDFVNNQRDVLLENQRLKFEIQKSKDLLQKKDSLIKELFGRLSNHQDD